MKYKLSSKTKWLIVFLLGITLVLYSLTYFFQYCYIAFVSRVPFVSYKTKGELCSNVLHTGMDASLLKTAFVGAEDYKEVYTHSNCMIVGPMLPLVPYGKPVPAHDSFTVVRECQLVLFFREQRLTGCYQSEVIAYYYRPMPPPGVLMK